jgi:hypothetical protein
VNGDVGPVFENGSLDLTREDTFSSELAEGRAAIAVADGRDRDDIDLPAGGALAKQIRDMVGLPERKPTAAGGNSNGTHEGAVYRGSRGLKAPF